MDLTKCAGTWFALPEMQDVTAHQIAPLLRWNCVPSVVNEVALISDRGHYQVVAINKDGPIVSDCEKLYCQKADGSRVPYPLELPHISVGYWEVSPDRITIRKRICGSSQAYDVSEENPRPVDQIRCWHSDEGGYKSWLHLGGDRAYSLYSTMWNERYMDIVDTANNIVLAHILIGSSYYPSYTRAVMCGGYIVIAQFWGYSYVIGIYAAHDGVCLRSEKYSSDNLCSQFRLLAHPGETKISVAYIERLKDGTRRSYLNTIAIVPPY